MKVEFELVKKANKLEQRWPETPVKLLKIPSLNFNEDGNQRKTFLGGSLSCIMQLMVIIFVIILLKRMFNNENDANYTR